MWPWPEPHLPEDMQQPYGALRNRWRSPRRLCLVLHGIFIPGINPYLVDSCPIIKQSSYLPFWSTHPRCHHQSEVRHPAWSTSVRQACRNCRVSLVTPLLASAASCNRAFSEHIKKAAFSLGRSLCRTWGPNRIMIEFGWCSTYSSTWAQMIKWYKNSLLKGKKLKPYDSKPLSMNSGIWIVASGGLRDSKNTLKKTQGITEPTSRSTNSDLNRKNNHYDGRTNQNTHACRLTIMRT